jgi:hypothetical protein
MRLLCPFCQKAIGVPDTEAGNAVHCPECGQQFVAPQLYTPAPAALSETADLGVRPAGPTPVPRPVPETYVHNGPATELPEVDLPHVPRPDREMSGYARMASIPLEPRVIQWIPAGALFLAFIMTLLPWDGLYPAGYPAFTQSPWHAAVASMSRDPVADDALRDGESKLGDVLDKKLHMNWFLFPHFLLLFPTLLLAIAGPIVDMAKIKLPPSIEQFWQYRPAILGVLTTLVLLFLLAQWASGFGLQRAVNEWVDADFEESKAAAVTPEKQQRWEMQVAMKKGAYHVKTTPWLRIALLMHLLATAAVVTEAGLMLRGKKSPPRLAAMW